MSTKTPQDDRTPQTAGTVAPTVDAPNEQASGVLIAQAVLGIAVGVIAILWPGMTLGALVLLFAVFALGAAAIDVASLFTPAGRQSWITRLGLALFHLMSGVAVLAWPGMTITVLVVLIGIWALISGVLEIIVAVSGGGPAPGHLVRHAVSGVISLALGIVLLLGPATGAISLVQVFGFFAIVNGLASLVALLHTRPGAVLPDPSHPPARARPR